ncbi:MAG: 5'-nucleotidase C-terminal domain-containing protein [Bacteroidia bacterium]|nr:5'-nucleotidase C-terminal domain-containing protein [Bacteroidia bacterium]
MKYFKSLKLAAFLLLFLSSCGKTGKQSIIILETTDTHGVIMPYDYIENEPLDASLANSASYVRLLRNRDNPVFLLDDGDNLQGQPAVYYYNFIDTLSPHFLSEAMNWLGYDAGTVGNHDIEAGHDVYDRLSKTYNFPLLAANAVDRKSGKPYFTPFVILEKKNVRIAVLGLITPAVPTWLPEELYSGIEFRDMIETAKLWMPEMLKQKPDLVVGLFHSGWNRDEKDSSARNRMNENGSAAVAYNVPGFDIIFCGHDHRLANEKFANIQGDSVLILNGGSKSQKIAQADVTFSKNRITGKKRKIISGKIIEVKDFKTDPDFIRTFATQDEAVKKYVNKVIGNSTETISSRDSYFGSSAFVDMIHSIQLEITSADISFAAPLSLPYNFDSATGIEYIVDASQPEGQRVNILKMSDGRKFDDQKKYRVAVNSHRGNGSGGHLTEGAGINSIDLMSRVLSSTERDLRYYIMRSIEEKKTISPLPMNNWKIIPEEWVKAAAQREYVLLFGNIK